MMKVIFYWSLHSSCLLGLSSAYLQAPTCHLNVVPNNNIGAEAQREKRNFSECGSGRPIDRRIHSANIRPTSLAAIWNMETGLLLVRGCWEQRNFVCSMIGLAMNLFKRHGQFVLIMIISKGYSTECNSVIINTQEEKMMIQTSNLKPSNYTVCSRIHNNYLCRYI
jgi:hypothetical protein